MVSSLLNFFNPHFLDKPVDKKATEQKAKKSEKLLIVSFILCLVLIGLVVVLYNKVRSASFGRKFFN